MSDEKLFGLELHEEHAQEIIQRLDVAICLVRSFWTDSVAVGCLLELDRIIASDSGSMFTCSHFRCSFTSNKLNMTQHSTSLAEDLPNCSHICQTFCSSADGCPLRSSSRETAAAIAFSMGHDLRTFTVLATGAILRRLEHRITWNILESSSSEIQLDPILLTIFHYHAFLFAKKPMVAFIEIILGATLAAYANAVCCGQRDRHSVLAGSDASSLDDDDDDDDEECDYCYGYYSFVVLAMRIMVISMRHDVQDLVHAWTLYIKTTPRLGFGSFFG